MYFVYVLYSKVFDKIDIGYTSDIDTRLKAHNHPENKGWTKKYQPWEIIYKELLSSKNNAIVRERQLKSFQGELLFVLLFNNYQLVQSAKWRKRSLGSLSANRRKSSTTHKKLRQIDTGVFFFYKVLHSPYLRIAAISSFPTILNF